MILQLYPEGAYEWQKEAHAIIDSNQGKTIVIKACRQLYGKTHFCLAELVRTCLQGNNYECGYVSPTLQLAQENYDRISTKLQSIILSANGARRIIKFKNGSRISFFSAGQKHALRGFHCSGLLVVDECAYIDDDVWNELIAAWALKHKPTIIMISTPFFRDGFFWNNFNNKDNVVLDWTTKYPQKETPFLLSIKDTMPLRQYNCEYRGEWLEAEGSVFSNFKHLLYEPTINKNEPLYIGIDWGTGSGKDSTALVGVNSNCDMKVLRTWTNTPPQKQIDDIVALLRTLNVKIVVAEENSIGKVYLDLLRKHINVKPFLTTNDSKRRIVDNLRTMIENSRIKLINDRELINQLVFYQEERTNTGKITYNAAKGKHDDIVIALSIAIDATRVSDTNIRIL